MAIDTQYLDADTDKIKLARPALLNMAQWINDQGLVGRVVDSIAALKAIDKTKFTRAFVTGYYSPGDGGGGAYWYDSADTTSADNGGTVIVATDGGRWKRIPGEYASVNYFGAKGGATNDTGAFAATLASLSANGGAVSLAKRGYTIANDGTGACVSVSAPVSIKGSGGVYASLNPSGVAADVHTFRYNPSTSYDHTLVALESVHIGNPATGTRDGDEGVALRTQSAGQNLSKFTVRDVIVGQGAGPGLAHFNDPVANVNGGLYAARFENSQIKGGIELTQSGDSISVSHCILSGTGIGVNANLVAGASLLAVENCNITNSGGSIKLDSGARFRLLGNNCEHYEVGASSGAVFDISGASGTMHGGVIKENLISAFGASDATRLLRMSNCVGTLVEDNVFLRGGAGVAAAIVIDANCSDVRIGANAYSSGWTGVVIDNGVGTMGVLKDATLQNSWAAFNASETARFIKSGDGLVHLYGTIKSGTITNGTLLFTLPVGFRPGVVQRAPVIVVNSGTPQIAELLIDTAGAVTINYVLANHQLTFNMTFPAANLANSEAV